MEVWNEALCKYTVADTELVTWFDQKTIELNCPNIACYS